MAGCSLQLERSGKRSHCLPSPSFRATSVGHPGRKQPESRLHPRRTSPQYARMPFKQKRKIRGIPVACARKSQLFTDNSAKATGQVRFMFDICSFPWRPRRNEHGTNMERTWNEHVPKAFFLHLVHIFHFRRKIAARLIKSWMFTKEGIGGRELRLGSFIFSAFVEIQFILIALNLRMFFISMCSKLNGHLSIHSLEPRRGSTMRNRWRSEATPSA